VRVCVTACEVRYAALVGIARDGDAKVHGRKPRWPVGTLVAHIVGALGELVVSKALGIYWRPVIDRRDTAYGDVAGYEVKATQYPDGYLRLRADAKPDRPYVLVTGEPPALEIRGWIYARDGMRAEWWDERDGEYHVPQSALADWETRPFEVPS